MKLRYCLVIAFGLAAGCGGSEDADTGDASDRETVFDPLEDAVERAESVQDTVDSEAAELRRRLEEAEGR